MELLWTRVGGVSREDLHAPGRIPTSISRLYVGLGIGLPLQKPPSYYNLITETRFRREMGWRMRPGYLL